jgi:hypothetical protein
VRLALQTLLIRATTASLAALGALGCRAPTEAFVDITVDGPCKDVVATGITAGLLGAIESKPYDTTTSECQAGSIGSIVLVPSSDGPKDAPFGFKVVTSLSGPVDACVPPAYGPQCIVARRAMRYVPHDDFHVPVRMSQACAGVVCPDTQSCVDGSCQSATVDPSTCTDPAGCSPLPTTVIAWQKQLGGAGQELARHLAVGADGTVLLVGNFADTIALGGAPLKSHGDSDAYVASYTQSGIFRWSTSFGGLGTDEALSVAVGPGGEVYVLVSFTQTVDFGGGPLTSKGGADIALVKLSVVGKPVWALALGGASDDVPVDVAVDQEGNVVLVGEFTGSTNLKTTKLTSAGTTDVFVASFTSAGDLRWAKSLGGAGEDGGGGIGVDAHRQLYVAGYFSGDALLGGTASATSLGGADVFVTSFDRDGAFRWTKTFGASANDHAFGLAARDERVVVTGGLTGKTKIDGTVLDIAGPSGFVAELGIDGKLAWARSFAAKGSSQGEGVSIAADGSVVVGGELTSGSIFGSAAIDSKGVQSPFVAVLDPDGTPRWAKAYGSSLYAKVTGVGAAPGGFAYLAGWFTDGLALGKEPLTSQGAEDTFFLHVAPP